MSVEHPNTVSGLLAKRAELSKLREALEAEVRKVTCDLDHLDAAIRLFDPETTPAAIRRYVVKYGAKKGAAAVHPRDAARGPTAPDIGENHRGMGSGSRASNGRRYARCDQEADRRGADRHAARQAGRE